jgi:hypothetical protein
MGFLHTNYTRNNTLENSQIQKYINKKESNNTTITYNGTGLHCLNLNLKCSSATEKTHYWTNFAHGFTALTLATAPLTVKTPDLN